ncbi:ABC transporter substrate-binding protein [Mobiluncus mulieris]|nr:ABC transporter substrate-binding protein [Mobiluncus mulieris]EFN93920.1 periplasmic binding protein [Mobiluncus mulieris FB024-16]MCU9976110.1 ABC transporter substrate-binding protein [Mobiluncus mulieris]MCU9994309.1 ABC transporter substrate-binding protein [Mobiluncus mulieris]MCU9997296.1 ABC transporter substrate-binding protein [Mobiluncus mulieris]NMW61457.1 ABC transporter substrate-binding protein [Mobiluncus mulieris]
MSPTKKIVAALSASCLTVSLLSGCAQKDTTSTTNNATMAKSDTSMPMTIKNCGVETTFDKHPSKVVSMGVTGLAYLIAAGADENKVIGRANEWGEQPAEWIGDRADKIKLLSNDQLSMEGLVSAQPDLAYGGGFSSEQLSPQDVSAKGIPAIVDESECHYFYKEQPQNESFNTILREIGQVGKLLNTSEVADKTVKDLKTQLDKIKKDNPGNGRTVAYAYYYGDADEDLFSYGNQGVIGEINNALGVKVAIDPNYHPHQGAIAKEAFVKSDPDMIFVLTGMGGATKESTMARLEKIPGFKDLKAVKNNQIFYAESAIGYASPSAIYGTIELAKQITK